MGRGISFNREAATEQAMRQFWKSGYAGTSLRDLLKATGLGEGSFYNTLKSKKQLYVECLQRYGATEGEKRAAALAAAPDTATGLRAMFDAVLDCLDDPATPSKVCMLAAMVSEDVFADEELRAFARTASAQFHDQLRARLAQDRERGLVRADLDPDLTASLVLTYAQGVWRMALIDYDRARFAREIDAFLAALGLAQRAKRRPLARARR
jgi:TetR/AcrR family transcriptional repressor of nem operon